MSRWYGKAKEVLGLTTLGGRAKVLGLATLGLSGGWKARVAWEEVTDASKPASVLARLARVPGYFFSASARGEDAKDRRITELEGKLRAASEKNEELQMCLDAQSNRHEFPTSPPPPDEPQPQRP